MHIWVSLLYWLGLAVASGLTVVLLFKIAKVDFFTLGELIVVMTASVVFSIGVVRTLTDWSLAVCILTGFALAIPMSMPFLLAFGLVMSFLDHLREK